jgi:PilZ domain
VNDSWRPVPGQVALIEYAEVDASPESQACLTGLVLSDNDGHVTVDLGASGPLDETRAEIVVSFFSPEALYRVRATARRGGPPAVIELDNVQEVERVQRRLNPRVALRLPVALGSFDDPSSGFAGLKGHTLDIGLGGMRVETVAPFPAGADPTVALTLDDGRHMVAHTRVVMADIEEGHCEYRLAFIELDDGDRALIASLVGDYRDGRIG